MPDTKISALTAGDPAVSTDAIPIARGGANFKVTAGSIAALSPAGTVTSVGGTGTVNGITLTGTVTSSGSLTLGGALSGVSLTTQVSGTLPTANGGTNLTTFTSGGAVYATSTSALTTGTLPTASGGTNLTSFTSGGAVYATSTSALTTGTLPLASGGTGQTTKAAAFNALSPITTTGDLILGNGTNSATRLAIGTNTYVLTSNGSTASWQPAAGGGGGVTSFDGGFTGLNPSSPTTGAVSLSGTLGVGYGGTGTSSFPSNGYVLIGNGSSYLPANLTAGAGISITNGPGSITIAATGGGGGYITSFNISTSGGSYFTYSGAGYAPLVGHFTSGPTVYGAAFFRASGSGYYVTSTGGSVNTIDITDSTMTTSFFTSGSDFSSFVGTFYVMDNILSFYGLQIYDPAMQTLFADSESSLTSPNLSPLDAGFAASSINPVIRAYHSGGSYSNTGFSGLGVKVEGGAGTYTLLIATGDTTPASGLSITSLEITINGTMTTYYSGSDYSGLFAAENSSSGKFTFIFSGFNATLQTLLNNSIR